MRARFIPQQWQNDFATTVNVEAECEWDVTPGWYASEFPEGPPERHSYESDRLRDDPAAPAWVREWPGPFEVELIEDTEQLTFSDRPADPSEYLLRVDRVADDDLSLGDPERRRVEDDTPLDVQVNLDGTVEFVSPHPVVVRGEPGWRERILELVESGGPFSVVCYPEIGGDAA